MSINFEINYNNKNEKTLIQKLTESKNNMNEIPKKEKVISKKKKNNKRSSSSCSTYISSNILNENKSINNTKENYIKTESDYYSEESKEKISLGINIGASKTVYSIFSKINNKYVSNVLLMNNY